MPPRTSWGNHQDEQRATTGNLRCDSPTETVNLRPWTEILHLLWDRPATVTTENVHWETYGGYGRPNEASTDHRPSRLMLSRPLKLAVCCMLLLHHRPLYVVDSAVCCWEWQYWRCMLLGMCWLGGVCIWAYQNWMLGNVDVCGNAIDLLVNVV